MDIKCFLEQFSDVIPFTFKLTLAPNSGVTIERNKDFVCYENHKGRALVTTKNGILDVTKDYEPLEKVDLPVLVEIDFPNPFVVQWEKTQATTKKKSISFIARVLTPVTHQQLGFMSLDLTPAGDIRDKYCSYYSNDGLRHITQSVRYEFESKTQTIKRYERLSYTAANLSHATEETVTFYKDDGVLTGLTINKQALKNHAFDSVVWSEDNVKEQNQLFARFSSKKEVEDATVSNCDMVNYLINRDFTARKKRIGHLERLLANKNPNTVNLLEYDRIETELRYWQDPENDTFRGFYGTYVGNTIIKNGDSEGLFIETERDGCRYFTFVNITDTKAFKVDIYHDRIDGQAYYDAIMNASKTPAFRLQLVNGSYTLVPMGDHLTEDETYFYGLFNSITVNNDLGALEDEGYGTLTLGKKPNPGDGAGRKLTPSRKNQKKKKAKKD